jgi:hypothetical protein
MLVFHQVWESVSGTEKSMWKVVVYGIVGQKL